MKTKTALILFFLVLATFLQGEVPRLSPQGVDLVTGRYVENNEDISLKGAIPLTLRRVFGTSIETPYELGGGWQWQISNMKSKLYQLEEAGEKNSLTQLTIRSKITGRKFGELQCKYTGRELVITDQRARSWNFFFTEAGLLEKVATPGGATLAYTYDAGQIVKRETDEGHILVNELYTEGNNSVAGTTFTLLPGDFRIGRVKAQKTVVERGGELQLIAEYLYTPNETTLIEPNGNKSLYVYNEGGEITELVTPLTRELFIWKSGHLVKQQIFDSERTLLLQKEFTFSDEGHPTEETLSGS